MRKARLKLLNSIRKGAVSQGPSPQDVKLDHCVRISVEI